MLWKRKEMSLYTIHLHVLLREHSTLPYWVVLQILCLETATSYKCIVILGTYQDEISTRTNILGINPEYQFCRQCLLY